MFFNKFKKGQFGFRIVTDHAECINIILHMHSTIKNMPTGNSVGASTCILDLLIYFSTKTTKNSFPFVILINP